MSVANAGKPPSGGGVGLAYCSEPFWGTYCPRQTQSAAYYERTKYAEYQGPKRVIIPDRDEAVVLDTDARI